MEDNVWLYYMFTWVGELPDDHVWASSRNRKYRWLDAEVGAWVRGEELQFLCLLWRIPSLERFAARGRHIIKRVQCRRREGAGPGSVGAVKPVHCRMWSPSCTSWWISAGSVVLQFQDAQTWHFNWEAQGLLLATERIRVWINGTQVLLSAAFPVREEIILGLYSVDERIGTLLFNQKQLGLNVTGSSVCCPSLAVLLRLSCSCTSWLFL